MSKQKEKPKRVIVITGGTAGVGRSTARIFAQDKCEIAILARGREGLNATEREIRILGGKGHSYSVDVSDADAVEEVAADIERKIGPIDVWINNAMTTIFAPLLQIEPREFQRATEVTYLGVVYGTMAALKRMYPRNQGTIIQVGSALSYRSIPLQSPYCGAKHAIRGFTNSLRSELIHDRKKIRLTMVQLPALNTPQFEWCRTKLPNHPQPVPPIYQPEVAARAIFQASRGNYREIRVGFSTEKAILGQKLIPRWLDRYLAKKAYDGQQTRVPIDPKNRLDNLFSPVKGDFGAHGSFDRQARGSARWESDSPGARTSQSG